MSTGNEEKKTCEDVRDELVSVIEGTASPAIYDHIADCDACRDLRHDAEQAEALAAKGGGDYSHPSDFEAKLLGVLDGRISRETAATNAPAPVTEKLPSAAVVAGKRDAAPVTERLGAPTEKAVPASSATERAALADADTEDQPAEHSHEVAPTPAPRVAKAVTASPIDRDGSVLEDGEERAPEAARPTSLAKGKSVVDLRSRRLRAGFAAGAVLFAAAASTGIYFAVRSSDDGTTASSSSRWAGKVTRVVRASQSAGEGVTVCEAGGKNCAPAVEGAEVKVGSVIRTDGFSRVSMKMGDGSEMVLDRGSEISLGADAPRSATMKKGAMVCDVAHLDNGQNARIAIPGGGIEVLGTKFAIFADDARSRVEVTRGVVRLTDEKGDKERVFAGEEGRLEPGRRVSVSPSVNVAEATEWSDRTDEKKTDSTGLIRGLGELRAKKPGAKDERDAAVRLAKHDVKVRIVDNVARTEIDETFQNDSDDELEGIFRFPLPPDAQIERLALEVGGKMEEGAFVERDKAAAIWRGVIQHAVPTAPKPVEEIIWVPGPWRDPALLEWKRGGRFELRIFPIPKKGARRVILAYTQTIAATGGVRRYTYPLPHDTRGSTIVDDFHVDLQVLGHDKSFGVRPTGYTLTDAASTGENTERKEMRQARFVPAGDLVVEYALPDRDREVSTWAYQPSTGTDTSPYAVLAIRPKLPRVREEGSQTHVVVVDSSRSMVGERFERAKVVAAQMIREMDGRDRVQLMACDTSCRPMDTRLLDAGAATADAAARFLGGITPDGATDAVAMVQHAKIAGRGGEGKTLHVVYVGDGGISAGPSKADHLTAEIKRLFPKGEGTVTAVAIGADADTNALAAMARGGGGVVVPYVPGQTASATAISALASSYGASLRSPELVLPAGFVAVSPQSLDTIRAGSETLILARMTSPNVEGEAVLRGKVGGESFEQKYPLKVIATSDQGNAFVPRLYAAARIADLERAGGDAAKTAIIDLSKNFAVASRYTSLLVLESQAMFTAFGLDRTRQSPAWTGEDSAQGSTADGTEHVAGEPLADASAASGASIGGGGLGRMGSPGHGSSAGLDDAPRDEESRAKDKSPSKKEAKSDMAMNPFGDARAPAPQAEMAAPPSMAPPSPKPAAAAAKAAPPGPMPSPTMAPPPPPVVSRRQSRQIDEDDAWRRRSQRMVPMRRIWERKGQVVNDLAVWHGTEAAKLIAAESIALSKPDNRGAQRDLFAQYALHGRLDRASEVAEKWASRDALDPDALVARADIAARQGDRENAIRILGGLADLRSDDPAAQNRLAGLFDRAVKPAEACAHRIALAEQRPTDVVAQAAAVPCARSTGFAELADRLLADVPLDKRAAVDAAIVKLSTALPVTTVRGDVQIDASWNAPVDLDVALVDKTGTRLSWLGAGKLTVTALGATDTSRESVGFVNLPTGDYVVEISRSRGGEGSAVSGTVSIRAAGGSMQAVPFVLTGGRAEVAHVKITTQSRLVPADGSFGGGPRWR